MTTEQQTLTGTDGDDYLNAATSEMNSLIQGLGGKDHLISGKQRDTLEGGEGNDSFSLTMSLTGPGPRDIHNDFVHGGAGIDFLGIETGRPYRPLHMDVAIEDDGSVTASSSDGLNVVAVEGLSITATRAYSFAYTSAVYQQTFSDAPDRSAKFEVEFSGMQSGIHAFANGDTLTIGTLWNEQTGVDDFSIAFTVRVERLYLQGGSGHDVLIATAHSHNNLTGNGGNDLVVGGDQSDHLSGGMGSDAVRGGAGDDYIFGDGVANTTTEDPMLPAGNDTLRGGDGNDIIRGDHVHHGPGTLLLNGGDDNVFGDSGDDTLYGNQGHDFLSGGSGNDSIRGDGEDSLALDGDDTLAGDSGDDILDGDGG